MKTICAAAGFVFVGQQLLDGPNEPLEPFVLDADLRQDPDEDESHIQVDNYCRQRRRDAVGQAEVTHGDQDHRL